MTKHSIMATLMVAVLSGGGAVLAAEPAQVFLQAGPSDYGYADNGIGIKLGADFSGNLAGVRNLGLTAFYAHTDGTDRYYDRRWKHEMHTFALGPAYTHPVAGSKWAVQGRAYLEIDLVRWDSACCRNSDTELNLGLGFGAQFALSNKLSLRADYDLLGSGVDLFSIGLGFRY